MCGRGADPSSEASGGSLNNKPGEHGMHNQATSSTGLGNPCTCACAAAGERRSSHAANGSLSSFTSSVSPGHHGQTGHLAEDIVEMSGNTKVKKLIDDVVIPEEELEEPLHHRHHHEPPHLHYHELNFDFDEPKHGHGNGKLNRNLGSKTGSKAEMAIEYMLSPTKFRREEEREGEHEIIKPHFIGEYHEHEHRHGRNYSEKASEVHHHHQKEKEEKLLHKEEEIVLDEEFHGGKVVGEIKVEHKFDKDGKPIHEPGEKKKATVMIVRNKHAKDPPVPPGHHGQTGHLAEDIVEMSGNKKAKKLIDDVVIPEEELEEPLHHRHHHEPPHLHYHELNDEEEEPNHGHGKGKLKRNLGSKTGSKAERAIEDMLSPTHLRREEEQEEKAREAEHAIIKPHVIGEDYEQHHHGHQHHPGNHHDHEIRDEEEDYHHHHDHSHHHY